MPEAVDGAPSHLLPQAPVSSLPLACVFCLQAATSLATHRWRREGMLIEGLDCWLPTNHPDGKCLPCKGGQTHVFSLLCAGIHHSPSPRPTRYRICPQMGCGMVLSVSWSNLSPSSYCTVGSLHTGSPLVILSVTVCKLDKWIHVLARYLLLEVTTQGNNKVGSSIQLPRFKSQLWNNVILVNHLITLSDSASFI